MSREIRFVKPKAQSAINREWDAVASQRSSDIRSAKDRSFEEVLQPWILRNANSTGSVIDVGCGTGHLTTMLRKPNRAVIGIDPSKESVRIARSHDPQGDYFIATAEDWARTQPQREYDLAVTNMVMMDVPDLLGFCRSLASLVPGGRVLGTITHPAFWPQYWGYLEDPNFNYLAEATIEAPFRTQSSIYEDITTHIHRPISQYIETFENLGFKINQFVEMRGPEDRKTFPFPRFIGIDAVAPGPHMTNTEVSREDPPPTNSQ